MEGHHDGETLVVILLLDLEVKKYISFMSKQLTSPVLQAEKVTEAVAHKWRNLLQVMGPNPGCQEGLVSISEGCVHKQQTLVGTDGLGEALGTVTEQNIPKAHRWVT